MLRHDVRNHCLTMWNDQEGVCACVCSSYSPANQMTGILSSGVTACRALDRAFLLGHSAPQPSTSHIPAVESLQRGSSTARTV